MHLPNEKIYKEMNREAAGIWFVEATGTDTHAILLKLPSNSLKAIVGGCGLKLSFVVVESKNNFLLVSCLHVYDDKSSPYMILNPHLDQTNQKALYEILQRQSTPIFLYDELCRNVAWAETEWDKSPTNLILLLSSLNFSNSSHSFKEIQYALDSLQVSLDSSVVIPDANQIEFEQLQLLTKQFNTIDIRYVATVIMN